MMNDKIAISPETYLPFSTLRFVKKKKKLIIGSTPLLTNKETTSEWKKKKKETIMITVDSRKTL